jgi:hypothetical protein
MEYNHFFHFLKKIQENAKHTHNMNLQVVMNIFIHTSNNLVIASFILIKIVLVQKTFKPKT